MMMVTYMLWLFIHMILWGEIRLNQAYYLIIVSVKTTSEWRTYTCMVATICNTCMHMHILESIGEDYLVENTSEKVLVCGPS